MWQGEDSRDTHFFPVMVTDLYDSVYGTYVAAGVHARRRAMQVKDLQKLDRRMRLAVVFSSGEEAVRGLTELARKRQLPGAHVAGIGALLPLLNLSDSAEP
jgi:hypothetical protein